MELFANSKKKSPWIIHYNAGSCNGCDIEILATLSPKYDVERFGIINKGNPKQADILLVTGPVTKRSRERLVQLYTQIPEPKVVISVGACTNSGGVFRDMYNQECGVDRYIPVDVYVAGCAARPEQVIEGVAKALEILEQKTDAIEKPKKLFGKINELFGQNDRREIAKTLKADDAEN